MLWTVKLFDGLEKKIVIYNSQAMINFVVEFFTVNECQEEVEFTFPGYISSFFRVYNERLGTELKDISLSHNGNTLIINASVLDMTFEDNGKYYYELGYVQTGGYEIVLQYGTAEVI